MEEVENIPVAQPKEKRLTYEDYVALTPPDNGNYELHQGKIIFMASPTPTHQDIVTELCARLRLFASAQQLGKVYTAPLDVVFSPIDTFQPDILFISTARFSIIGEKKIEGAPDLVIEVLSESNIPKEMSYKKHIYESSGVEEYWLINLAKSTVTVYFNVAGELMPVGIFKNNDRVESQVLTGFAIGVSEILEV